VSRNGSGRRKLAILGGDSAFARPVHVGQMNFPDFDRYRHEMYQLFERGWYTNQGPLAEKLETRLAQFFEVDHAVVVTNATIGLMMVLKALGSVESVLVPSFTFVATAQAVVWCGLRPVLSDVELSSHQLSRESVMRSVGSEFDAIVAVNLWGGTCDPSSIEEFARERGVPIVFDSAQAVGVKVDGKPLGAFGTAEVFSFHATKILNATEGGCVTTNDPEMAARLRNIRSSYGAAPPVKVPVTANGRFSEAQAAIALMSLEDFVENRERNAHQFARYCSRLRQIDGIRVVRPAACSESNFQYLVLEVDEHEFGLSRDDLVEVLHAEKVLARRYFAPGVHRCPPFTDGGLHSSSAFPATERLSESVLQLPIGSLVDDTTVDIIAELISSAQVEADAVSSAVRQ
jgi:dTDP-4-amino-4,6-dideoxygalactose transaminase